MQSDEIEKLAQQKLAQFDAQTQQNRDKFIDAVEQAAAKNEKKGNPISPEAFKAIIRVYDEEFPRFRAEIRDAFMYPDREHYEAAMAVAKKHVNERTQARINAIPGGKEAMMAAGQEANGGGFIVDSVKKVYDSDRGGFQWGGVGGALLGGFIANKLLDGYSNVVKILGMIAGTALFAYLGDKFLDKPAEKLNAPDFHSNPSSPGQPPSNNPGQPPITAEADRKKEMERILATYSPRENQEVADNTEIVAPKARHAKHDRTGHRAHPTGHNTGHNVG